MWRLWTRGWGPRNWWYWFKTQGFPLWIANHTPKRILYWCFIKVCAFSEPHASFQSIADKWVSEHKLD
jgi:hypothetical protein